ncbi:leukocyte antigen CD37 isoform X2 [Ornithorhynchus anatinus]|nr:leukocyte antigen CD37 isoform X2 [Ornithorhynchus anatinus]XP_028929275.1 leukocyte antigen CD37 isoform X2 [Ornithorhynchus anatinus]XP_039769153.1 leukocyte antigen CD37 isoform X2 [Ornithorhynchus anatinus]
MSPKAGNGCLSLTKYFLFVFNLFFFVLGGLLFCFGLWILFDRNSFASFLGVSYSPLRAWSFALSASGILTMLLGFLGCLGALKEIRCLLGCYFGVLLLLFTAQITLGVLIYTQRGRLKAKVGEVVVDLIENYQQNPGKERGGEENWDYVQFQLHCCGWASPQDWTRNPGLRSNSSAPHVPCSCRNSTEIHANVTVDSTAVLVGPGAPVAPIPSGFCPGDVAVYREGCARSVHAWLNNNLISIVGVCLGIALLEVLSAGLTWVLSQQARPWGALRTMLGEGSEGPVGQLVGLVSLAGRGASLQERWAHLPTIPRIPQISRAPPRLPRISPRLHVVELGSWKTKRKGTLN